MQKSYLSLWAGSYISSCPECSSSPRKCWDTSFCPFVQLHLIVNQIKFNGGDNYFFPVTVFFFLISLLPNGLSIFSSHMSRGLKNSSSNCSQVNTSATGYFQAFYDTPQLIKSIARNVNQEGFFLIQHFKAAYLKTFYKQEGNVFIPLWPMKLPFWRYFGL